jgi:NTE family protein
MSGFGLVLGAGGIAGEAFHRGVVRALDDAGLDPRAADVVVGTSAGSIVAASIRRHTRPGAPPPLAVRVRPRFADRAGALELVRRPRQAVSALLLRPAFLNGRVSPDFILDALRASHGMAWPEAALWIVAVRRGNGRRVVFGMDGQPPADVGAAVAASCAIPGYFSAVDIDGVSYVDGGVHSPTNADLLSGCDLDLVVVSSPMSMRPRAIRTRLDVPPRLLFHRYLLAEVWALRRRGCTVLTIEPDAAVLKAMGLNLMSGRRIHEIEDRAYALAAARLRQLQPRVAPASA